MSIFSERLRRLREEKRPTPSMYVVSQLCGLHTGAIRRYERGEAEPTLSGLVAIAEFYSVPIDYLAGLTENRDPY